MLAAYTDLKNAEKVKQFLAKKNLLNLNYQPVKELGHIYFPITKKVSVPAAQVVDTKFSSSSCLPSIFMNNDCRDNSGVS